MFCRTFPFTFDYYKRSEIEKNGKIDLDYTEKAKLYCPGIGNDAPIINHDFWIKLARKVLKELNDNRVFNDKWNISVRNKQIIASAKNFINKIRQIDDSDLKRNLI